MSEPMAHEQLDLRRELQDLADRILETGVRQGQLDPGMLRSFEHYLNSGIENPDAGYRAMAISSALKSLAAGIASAVHKPIDEPPSS